jgi:hypothetical protein
MVDVSTLKTGEKPTAPDDDDDELDALFTRRPDPDALARMKAVLLRVTTGGRPGPLLSAVPGEEIEEIAVYVVGRAWTSGGRAYAPLADEVVPALVDALLGAPAVAALGPDARVQVLDTEITEDIGARRFPPGDP